MSYESPIEIICGKMKNQLENDVYSVVQSYGIKVDKGELINALEYDRNQYQQGYADAKAELERKKGEWTLYESSQTYMIWKEFIHGERLIGAVNVVLYIGLLKTSVYIHFARIAERR